MDVGGWCRGLVCRLATQRLSQCARDFHERAYEPGTQCCIALRGRSPGRDRRRGAASSQAGEHNTGEYPSDESSDTLDELWLFTAEIIEGVDQILGPVDAQGNNLGEILDGRLPPLGLEFLRFWNVGSGPWIQSVPPSRRRSLLVEA